MDSVVSVQTAPSLTGSTALARASRSPVAVALVTLLAYVWWLALFFASGHHAEEFIVAGHTYMDRPGVSTSIALDRRYVNNGTGYDGQFYWAIAVDPVHARAFVDNPSYRYSRVLYPMVARALALGRRALIPYTLILVNLLAVAVGTLAVAAWLRRNSVSPWWALCYGFYCGLFIAFQRDLTEPLSYALIACGVYLFDFGKKHSLVWSALCFALAILARDKAALFALMYAARLVWPDSPRRVVLSRLRAPLARAAVFLAIAAGPMALYRLFLWFWLHSLGLPANEQVMPFQGMSVASAGHSDLLVIIALTVLVPSAICGVMALFALWKRAWRPEVFLLLLVIQVGVVNLHPNYYQEPFGVQRVAISVVLAALYCLPLFDAVTRGNRLWLVASSFCWLWLTALWFAMGALLLA